MKKKTLLLSIVTLLSLTGCVKYNGLPPEEAECEHTYSVTFSYDETNHWKVATCEHTDLKKEYSEHTYGEYVISQEATLTSDGKKVGTCSVCGYKNEVIIPKGTKGDADNTNTTGTITGITVDRENIEMNVGDSPISLTARLVGEGTLPTSITVSCEDMPVKTTVEGEEVTKYVKVVQISSTVVESGSAFSVTPVAEGTTKIVVYSPANPEIKKEIAVKINAKVEKHFIEFTEHSIEIDKGSQRVLTCKASDSVTWTSSDSTIVGLENLTNSGVWLIGKKQSETPVTITATICAGTANELSETCEVTVGANEQMIFKYYYINNQRLTDIHLFMWDENGHNEDWPGVALTSADYLNKDSNEVYQIVIDKEERDYKNIIISGNDSNGEFVQTSDIPLSSFLVQNAFTIPTLPSDVTEGARKASVKVCSFDPTKDILEDADYITLSMNEATIIAGNSVNINTYTSADEVTYAVTGDIDSIEVSNASSSGLTIKGLKSGNAQIDAKIGASGTEKHAFIEVEVIEDELITYYFTNNYLWTDLKLFMWNDNTGRSNASFPGVSLTNKLYTDENGKDVYAIESYKIADNWQGFIISGKDENRTGDCKTVDILFEDFGENNNVKMNEWKEGEENVANVKFNNLSNEKIYLITGLNYSVKVGSSIVIPVSTNADSVTYGKRSGKDFIDISEETNSSVKITGVSAGTSTIDISVGEGDEKITKIVSIKVVEEETITILFMNEFEWTDIHAYLYIDDNHKNANWPGVKMTLVDHDNRNKEIYAISYLKVQDGYTHIIFNGYDVVKGGRAQTEDIDIADIPEDKRCAYVTGWKDESKLIAKWTTILASDFLNIDKTSKTLKVGDTWNLDFYSNKDVDFVCDDADIVSVTKVENHLVIKALKEGTTCVSLTINNDMHSTKRCEITVTNDEPIPETYKYTIGGLPSWFGDSNPKFYAWIWGSGVTSQWIECSLVDGKIQFESTYENITGCLIVRYKTEFTGTPSFDHKKADGVWNKTNDIDISNRAGTYSGLVEIE